MSTIAPAQSITELHDEVRELARMREAVILAHNYQVPEVQDIADYVGDSLGLAREGAATDAPVIAFCGVHFMAETASILSPDKTVLIPDLDAGCSLAASITGDQLRAWKAEHPDAVVVSYVNTTADVKAETDYCCTSGNAVSVVEAIPEGREILFLPDLYLGLWVERVTGRKLTIWMGECHVHAGIRPADIERWQAEAPDAEFLVHPECGCASQCMAFGNDNTHILSTEGMIKFARQSPKERFLVATETGILHRLAEGSAEEALRGRLGAGDLQVHEDDHAREAPRLPPRHEARGQSRAGHRSPRAPRPRAHGRDRIGQGPLKAGRAADAAAGRQAAKSSRRSRRIPRRSDAQRTRRRRQAAKSSRRSRRIPQGAKRRAADAPQAPGREVQPAKPAYRPRSEATRSGRAGGARPRRLRRRRQAAITPGAQRADAQLTRRTRQARAGRYAAARLRRPQRALRGLLRDGYAGSAG